MFHFRNMQKVYVKKKTRKQNVPFFVKTQTSKYISHNFLPKSNVCISCTENWVLWSEGPFYHESVVIHSYILVHQIWQEITSIWCFLAIKCQLSNTLKHVCFDKMPRNWEFALEIHSLFQLLNWSVFYRNSESDFKICICVLC